MEPIEYDVFVCHVGTSGSGVAKTIAAGLARRGFRVFEGADAAGGAEADRRRIIDQIPDFVVVLAPDSVDACADGRDPGCVDLAHAIETDRNIVPVHLPAFAPPSETTLPPALAALDKRQPIPYSARAGADSIARIAHRLSSDAAVGERDMLRQAKWVGSFVTLVLVALVAVAAIGIASKMFARRIDVRPLPPLVLHWSVFGQRLENGAWTEYAVKDGAQARGSQVRVAFSPSADGYAYVIGRDARGDVEVLFPTRSLKAESRVKAGQVYQAPADGSWLAVDEASGLDTVYVIASYDPIENLESLLDERDEEATAARGAFVDSTISGLLDGKHGGATGRVRTRSGRPLADNVPRGAGASSASVTLSWGTRATHPLAPLEGLVSATVELRFRSGAPAR